MRDVADWLREYGSSHAHRTNKLLHWICVPLIVLAVMGAAVEYSGARPVHTVESVLNWATLAASLAVAYYAWLSLRSASRSHSRPCSGRSARSTNCPGP
ncbi:MAG: Mpo1-like protein [Gammaproteobacteria bacterium]